MFPVTVSFITQIQPPGQPSAPAVIGPIGPAVPMPTMRLGVARWGAFRSDQYVPALRLVPPIPGRRLTIAPNSRPRVPRCGHGRRSLGRTGIREGGQQLLNSPERLRHSAARSDSCSARYRHTSLLSALLCCSNSQRRSRRTSTPLHATHHGALRLSGLSR